MGGGRKKSRFFGSFSFSPHLQNFTCKFVDYIVRLLWKFTYRLIRLRKTYLVFILNLVKPLVTLIYWSSCEVGGKGKRAVFSQPFKQTCSWKDCKNLFTCSRWRFFGSFSSTPPHLTQASILWSNKHRFYGLTSIFTRLSMKTKYVCHGNFRDNRTMWTVFF